MFLDLDELCRAVLSKRPSVALVTWTSPVALRSFVGRFGPALRKESPDTVLSKLACADLDSASFQEKLLARLTGRDAAKRCLLVYRIEPLAPAAAGILNGYRERLAVFRAVVVAIREDRREDFRAACPDLMDWVGTSVVRAEDVGPPITLRDVNASIGRLEKRFGINSKEFQEKWARGAIEPSDDYWIWNDLLAIRAGMKAAKR